MAYDDIQQQIDSGRQQAANELGPPYNVFRMVNADSGGNVLIANNQIATSLSILTRIAYGGQVRTSFEAEKTAGHTMV